jgi:hypothetical protein
VHGDWGGFDVHVSPQNGRAGGYNASHSITPDEASKMGISSLQEAFELVRSRMTSEIEKNEETNEAVESYLSDVFSSALKPEALTDATVKPYLDSLFGEVLTSTYGAANVGWNVKSYLDGLFTQALNEYETTPEAAVDCYLDVVVDAMAYPEAAVDKYMNGLVGTMANPGSAVDSHLDKLFSEVVAVDSHLNGEMSAAPEREREREQEFAVEHHLDGLFSDLTSDKGLEKAVDEHIASIFSEVLGGTAEAVDSYVESLFSKILGSEGDKDAQNAADRCLDDLIGDLSGADRDAHKVVDHCLEVLMCDVAGGGGDANAHNVVDRCLNGLIAECASRATMGM